MDERAAKTGEMTLHIAEYPHPMIPQIVLYDFPGGTKNHSFQDYFQDRKLPDLDCIIVVFSGRFTELDFEITKKAQENNIPLFLIRNKMDQAIASKKQKLPKKTLEDIKQLLRKEISEDVQSKLGGLRVRDLYFVTARRFTDETIPDMDERKLYRDILNLSIGKKISMNDH